MSRLSVLHFYPERVAWIGAAILGAVFLLTAPLVVLSKRLDVSVHGAVEKEAAAAPLSFSLGLSHKGPSFPIPNFSEEMTFSFDPPRPSKAMEGQRLLVRMKKGAESRRVTMPCRIDLEIQKGKLAFAKEKSPFWVELTMAGNGMIGGRGYITSPEEGKIDAGTFWAAVEECPLQGISEFPDGSPFRLLAEARWWGRDLLQEQHGGDAHAERLEVGTEFIEIKEGGWLVWDGKSWQKSGNGESDKPIARMQSLNGKELILEGWDLDGHVRMSIHPAPIVPFKMKGEDLFSAIRIRSEKQISCMLEKQCMVLKTGDWVLKTGGRWKILRKTQEREAYLNGKLVGELFVFEEIHAKQGQKMIQGRFFNPGRTQTAAVEMAAQSTRKTGGKNPRRGKAP